MPQVEVAYVSAGGEQALITVRLAPGATVREAIEAAGITARFPEIDLARQPVGVYGERVTLDTALQDGDRVEIYRPLIADPKEARRKKAARRGKSRER